MKRVLLVNDSKFESIIMKDILNIMGYDVKVSDEYDAIGLVKTFKPDLFIANYIMKDIKGDQLISIVKLENPSIKCFLCSSNSSVAETVKNRRIDGFISTPVQESILERVITKAITDYDSVDEVVSKKDTDNRTHLKTFCKSCAQEVNKVGEKQFAFCPYCGHRL